MTVPNFYEHKFSHIPSNDSHYENDENCMNLPITHQ